MLPVRICAGGVGTTGVPTATGQHRDDEVTRTELVGWTETRIRKSQHHSPRNKRACAAAGVCAKEIKTLLTKPTSLEMFSTVIQKQG
jgi:hypothetical protein